MPLPMARVDAPTTVRRSGVIFPNGTCFARDDVKQKKEPDVSFLLEIETLQQAGINGLTERQRAQLIVALEQAYYDAMERLGARNPARVKRGDVVVAQHLIDDEDSGSSYVGVVERVTKYILTLRWFTALGKATILQLPRASFRVEVVPGRMGMEGLAQVLLVHSGDVDYRSCFSSNNDALQYLTDMKDIEYVAQHAGDGDVRCAATALLTSWRKLIEILIDAQREGGRGDLVNAVHDRLVVLVETMEAKELLEFGELVDRSNLAFDEKLAKVVTQRFQSLVETFDRDIADRVVNLSSWPDDAVDGSLYDAIIAKFPDIQLKKGHYVR